MSKNLYQVRIDGEIMPNSFTYEELLLNGILEFDDIYIKNVYNQYWCKVSEFIFPEEQDPAYLDGLGESKAVSQATFEIDDCGQVINLGNIINTHNTTPYSSNTTSNNTNQNHSNQSSDDGSIWKIIFTIIAIIIVIILFCNNVISGTVAAICGYMIIRQIWKD